MVFHNISYIFALVTLLSMEKRYLIRLYALTLLDVAVIKSCLELGLLDVKNIHMTGGKDVKAIVMVECSTETLEAINDYGLRYLPLNHYEDFTITCPKCHQVIEDDMIYPIYDEHFYKGENIRCNCGFQMADVEYNP